MTPCRTAWHRVRKLYGGIYVSRIAVRWSNTSLVWVPDTPDRSSVMATQSRPDRTTKARNISYSIASDSPTIVGFSAFVCSTTVYILTTWVENIVEYIVDRIMDLRMCLSLYV